MSKVPLQGPRENHRKVLGALPGPPLAVRSSGLASVLIATDVPMVKARGLVERVGRLATRLPVAGAAAVTVLGLAIAFQALLSSGIVVLGE